MTLIFGAMGEYLSGLYADPDGGMAEAPVDATYGANFTGFA